MKRFQASPIISVTGAKSRFDLGQSYGPNLRLGDFLTSDTLQNLAHFELGYEHPQGNVRLRETIARSYEADAEDVVVTTGAMHAIFLLAFALCDRGDEVVMTSPQFPPTLDALESVGANVRTLRLSFDDRYDFDSVAFGRLLSAKTRLVVLTSPQNPSGIFIPQEQITALLEIVQERSSDAYVVVDETYREASFGENAVAASSLSLHPRVAVIASLSKCHGAPGLRIGWMITQDHALREQLILAKFHSAVACGALDEAIAVRLLEQQGRILNERRASLAQCLAKTEEFVADHQRYLEWVRPDSGALCCMRLRSSMYDDDAVERFYQALETRGVLVSKGVWFGEAANVFRVGFGHGTIEELTEAYGELGCALMEAATVGIATS